MKRILFLTIIIFMCITLVAFAKSDKKGFFKNDNTPTQSTTVNGCVELDIESPPIAYLGESVTFSAEITNCSDEAGLISLSTTIEVNEHTFGPFPGKRYLAAGETKAHSFTMTVPFAPWLVDKTFTVCVEATFGTAQASDCTSTTFMEQ